MHPMVTALVRSLKGSHGEEAAIGRAQTDTVARLARVYEVARNALEYRADHLVRRASIERILKRHMVFEKNEERLTDALIQELVWARYVSDNDLERVGRDSILGIISKYMDFVRRGEIDRDWLIGIASSEIEEVLNPNIDYQQFTTFAFHVIKQRVRMPEVEHLDLLLFVAIDRVYSQSDDARVGHHLFKMIAQETGRESYEAVTLAWKRFKQASTHKSLNAISVFVRKQMGPLVLIRDVYFSNPVKFGFILDEESRFRSEAGAVLDDQLHLMQGRISTATSRSITYVFLTKMLFALLFEIPLERMLYGGFDFWHLAGMVAVPVALMWILVSTIKLPNEEEQLRLVNRATQILFDFEAPSKVEETLLSLDNRMSIAKFVFYYLLLGLLSLALFIGIGAGLIFLQFTVISVFVFIFFLCIIMFFAYRIRQTAQIYTYYPKHSARSSLWETLALPLVVIGGKLSREVSRLNFLVFFFDFVLEAPFKIILQFLDSWTRFVSAKRDEAVG